MKKLIIIALLLCSTFAFAGEQGARSDANRNVFWIAPKAIVTIAADTAVDATEYVAIVPMTDVAVYLGTASSNTFTVLAYTVLTLPKGQDLKLKTQTKCMAF